MLQPIGGDLIKQRVGPDVKRTICKFFVAGTCDKGNLCTWAHGEHELGEPIGTDLFDQQDLIEDGRLNAKLAGELDMGPNAKRTICKFWQQGICNRGIECTFAHGVEDMKVDVQDEIPPVLAPMAGAPNGTKRTICKFWEEGACTKGDVCTFAHGAQEIGVPISLLAEPMLPGAEALIGRHPAPIGVPIGTPPTMTAPAAAMNGTKRTICKFWEEGACTKGDVCTFAHGAQEIGVPISLLAEPMLPGAEALIGRHPAPTGIPIGAPPTMIAPAAAMNGTKRTICKFWEQGACTRGADCTWAHGEEELGAPAPMEQGLPRAPMGNSPAAPSLGKGCGMAPMAPAFSPAPAFVKGAGGKSGYGQKTVFQRNPLGSLDNHIAPPMQAPAAKGIPIGLSGGKGAPEQPIKKTICKFWLEGQCSRGQDCTWAHGVEDQAVPAHVALGVAPSGPPPVVNGPAEVRRTICKFWQQGKCTQAAGQCTWAHGEWEIGTQVGTVSNGGGYQGSSVFKRPRLA